MSPLKKWGKLKKQDQYRKNLKIKNFSWEGLLRLRICNENSEDNNELRLKKIQSFQESRKGIMRMKRVGLYNIYPFIMLKDFAK